MEYTIVENLSFANAEQTLVNCAVNFVGIGVVPFTASPVDSEPHGVEIFNRAVAGDFGEVSPFSPPVYSLETLKDRKKALLRLIYDNICNGKDPSGEKDIYVDCIVSGTTYRMNAGKTAAENMDSGVRIFERAGAATMPEVRDFYNHNYIDVPIADAIMISLLQGQDALGYWQEYGVYVDAIDAAQDESELDAIDISFSINTE